MSEFFVIKRGVCPECQGKKWLSHPAWLEYGEWFELEGVSSGHTPTEAEDEAWWREHGYWNERPPEEYSCSTCEGEGTVEQEVNFRQALDELGVTKAMRIAYTAAAGESEE
jgi:hypothetical protein